MMVLLSSQSASCCERWRKALKGQFVLHEVSDKHALVSTLREFKPTVLVLDCDSKRFANLALVSEITQISPLTRVIVLTNRASANGAATAIAAGAKGYYSKGLSGSLLKKAVRVVANGELWISRQHVSALIEELIKLNNRQQSGLRLDLAHECEQTSVCTKELTQRQSEIVRLVATGMPNKLISEELHISDRTVKAHLTEIFRRLGVTGRTELAVNVCKLPNSMPCRFRVLGSAVG